MWPLSEFDAPYAHAGSQALTYQTQASGNSGSHMTDALLKNGKHSITALTREGSEAKFPDGVVVQTIDYEKPETIVKALQGQDALVITLSGFVPEGTETKLIDAAGEAGVKWIFPNEWSPDTANEQLNNDVFVFKHKRELRVSHPLLTLC
jgi:saccharopine dehydrogenase-like NADP-dependent oxidoreductase